MPLNSTLFLLVYLTWAMMMLSSDRNCVSYMTPYVYDPVCIWPRMYMTPYGHEGACMPTHNLECRVTLTPHHWVCWGTVLTWSRSFCVFWHAKECDPTQYQSCTPNVTGNFVCHRLFSALPLNLVSAYVSSMCIIHPTTKSKNPHFYVSRRKWSVLTVHMVVMSWKSLGKK